MKVFISWSGDRSKRVAELLHEWLQKIIQALKPWYSGKDIAKGSNWGETLQTQLALSKAGKICLTKENKNAPWVLFEAGAIARGISKNKVCPFLVDFAETENIQPLSMFQATAPSRDEIFKLCESLNDELGNNNEEPLDKGFLGANFDKWWPDFETEIKKIITETETPSAEPPERTSDDKLDEVLLLARGMNTRIAEMAAPETAKIWPAYRATSYAPGAIIPGVGFGASPSGSTPDKTDAP